MNLRKFLLMDGTPGAAGGGDGAPAAAAAHAAGDPAAAAPAASGDGGAPAGNVLANAAGTPPAAQPNDWIPEKFRVMNGDKLDIEASAKKLAESYGGLEKRVGSGDVPPKSAEEYTVNVPDQLKDAWQEDDRFKSFRADALSKGLTQAQFDFVMDKYFTVVPEMMQGAVPNVETATAELRKSWVSDQEFQANIQDAYKAFHAFADPADREKMDEIGNSPVAVRLLAKIGKEMGEAGGISPQATGADVEDITSLLVSEAAGNPKHPEHKATRAKIDKYYAAKYGNAPA